MRFFSLPNLSSTDISDLDPRKAEPRPNFDDKNEFRAWCNNIATQHCFYSHSEGIVPGNRVTKDNYALFLHGWTADFDADTPLDEALKMVKRNGSILPRYISQTFSNGIRLTWEFEDPILVDNKDLAARFLEELADEVGIKRLLAGFDHASLKLEQYYEAGTNWTEVGDKVISAKTLGLLFYRAAGKIKIRADGPQIPIEVIESEVLTRWPQMKSLKVGDRTPLFWVEPFEDRVGAQVGDHGMICYSSRAGKSFVPWTEILGPEFTRQYQEERIGAAAEDLYFDGGHYWRKSSNQEWLMSTKEDTVMYLKCRGISHKPEKKLASEAEEVLMLVQEQHSVKAAAPIVHDKRLIAVLEGEKYLNISTRRIMTPADVVDESRFPWLMEFFSNIWSEPKDLQKWHYLAWIRHAYNACLVGAPTQGQAVFISGPPSSGKTFLNYHILGPIFGGKSDATEFLMGRTNFNKADAEAYIWAIDDTKGASSWESRSSFTSNLKKHIANPQVRCEGKGKNAFTIPWKGRISITCNMDKESRGILPQLNSTILDKICLFEWSDWKAPFKGSGASEAEVAQELPYFLAWLKAWAPPGEVMSDNPRYGVSSYHHPSLIHDAHEMSAAARLQEMLDIWIEEADLPKEKLWLTPTGLRKLLAEEPTFRDSLNKEFGRERMAQALQDLELEVRKSGRGTQYLVYDPKSVKK